MKDDAQLNPQLIMQEEGGMDFKKLLYTFLQYRLWFIVSIITCLTLAFIYLRYTTPIYKINSKILIKDDKSSGSASPQDLLSQLDIFNTQNNVNNEKEIMQTHFLIRHVVDELHLNISYFAEGKVKSTELYNNCPFKIELISLKDSIKSQQFKVKYLADKSQVIIENKNVQHKYHIKDTIKTSDVSFLLIPTGNNNWQNISYQIDISTPDAVTENYLQKLNFSIGDKEASVIEISLLETVPKKGEDILNKLYEVYTRMNEEDKNKITDSTISFIDGRLAVVSNQLSGVEKNVAQFKENNQLSTNIPEQARIVLNNASDVQKLLTQQDVQISVVQSIEDHLKTTGQKLVPNAGVIQDPTYITTVQEYNTLVLERDRQLQTTKPDNPVIQNLNTEIETVKNNLLISLGNIKSQMQISRNELASKNDLLMSQIKSGPEKERAFLDISREQDVKQQLYLYLLQKREETAISKSGTLSNSRLIEPGKSDETPTSPKRPLLYLVGLCVGILLPTASIYLKNSLNNKITDTSDIVKETNVPILGELGHNLTGKTIVVEQNSRTALAEQFRALRTNLQFFLKGQGHQTIMITSSTSGEGKSFLTINLGCALAISNKKVLLMELDLRKPKISKELGISRENGFTDYLVSNFKKENLIKQTSVNPNLFIITAGTIPPNPAELLLNKETDELFTWLKTQFDYIIIDTPPAGVVIDPVLIAKYADASIYVVRQNYTLKEQLQIVTEFKQNEKMPNLSILLNDVKLNNTYGYKYGYHYGYSYAYGSDYYSDSQKPKWNFLKKSKKS